MSREAWHGFLDSYGHMVTSIAALTGVPAAAAAILEAGPFPALFG